MTYTIEDTIEILAGLRPRIINIRVDYNEKNLIKSIGRQTANGLALTDRQLELALKKIEKYKENLEKNNIDVDALLLTKPLRFPLREIDRSQTVSIGTSSQGKSVIIVKSPRSKQFSENWQKMQHTIIGECVEQGTTKEISLNETNILAVVDNLQKHNFLIDTEVLDIYQKIEKIMENPMNYVPYVDLEDDRVSLKNTSNHCIKYLNTNVSDQVKSNFLNYISVLKNYGFYHKSSKILEKIEKDSPSELVKKTLSNSATRFRIDPAHHSIENLLDMIETTMQWPVLVLVDDDHRALDQVLSIYNVARHKIENKDITVFFRIEGTQKNSKEFTQFIKDNQLNNYIDTNTKLVFIAKNKIPKPLIKSEWKPNAAILLSSYDFGKTSAFLDDIPVVYYYNNSITVRHNKIKGARQIAQL
jgi:hypothetical protein